MEPQSKENKLGINVKKGEDYSRWYKQVITKSEMVEKEEFVFNRYFVRPWAYAIWISLKEYLGSKITASDVRNVFYAPSISVTVPEEERAHLLQESEDILHRKFRKWSEDAPGQAIRVNMWCEVMKVDIDGTPFMRSREFLWQEGHTAHATKEEAEKEVDKVLELYSRVYTDLLAIPVVKGRKSEKDKYDNVEFASTVVAYVPVNGRGIEGASVSHLKQFAATTFDITLQDPQSGEKRLAWQNSCGISTRSIGAMVMIHGDDKGLVLPPKVAAVQVIVIQCGIRESTSAEKKDELLVKAREITQLLKDGGIRAESDVTPGRKDHWELKGVPIRVELQPMDVEKSRVTVVIRHSNEEHSVSVANIVAEVKQLLKDIHHSMLKKAEAARDAHMKTCTRWEEFTPLLDGKNIVLSPFCGGKACEDRIKDESNRDESTSKEPGTSLMGAKTLCIPLEQPKEMELPDKCINPHCQERARFFALFGRSY